MRLPCTSIRRERPVFIAFFDRFSNDDVGAGTSPTNNVFFAGRSSGGTDVGSTWSEWSGLATNIVRFVRFERNGQALDISVSSVGSSWNGVVSVAIPEQF